VNIITGQDLPDPQGMSGILGRPSRNGTMFRDMSGLNATIGFAQSAMDTRLRCGPRRRGAGGRQRQDGRGMCSRPCMPRAARPVARAASGRRPPTRARPRAAAAKLPARPAISAR
jgi:hypothetical protein